LKFKRRQYKILILIKYKNIYSGERGRENNRFDRASLRPIILGGVEAIFPLNRHHQSFPIRTKTRRKSYLKKNH
jgi:hypothetical protein